MSTNFYNPYAREEVELYHHGISGQKWGKRNGPPYPLNSSTRSSSENKARKKEDRKKSVNRTAIKYGLKPVKSMTDEEIDEAIRRLKKEETYKRAKKGLFGDVTKEQVTEGRRLFNSVIDISMKSIVAPVTAGALLYYIRK